MKTKPHIKMKTPHLKHMIAALPILAALLLCAGTARAQTIWTGGVDNAWTNTGNWTLGVPGATDQAIFAQSGAGSLTNISLPSGNRSVGSLLFNNENTGAAVTINGSMASTDRLTWGVNGGVTVQAGVGDVRINLGNSAAVNLLQDTTGTTVIENASAGSTLSFAQGFGRVGTGNPVVSVRGSGNIVVERGLSSTAGAWTLESDFTGRLTSKLFVSSNRGITVNGGTLVLESGRNARTSTAAALTVNNGTLLASGTIGRQDNNDGTWSLNVNFNDGSVISPGNDTGAIGTLTFENFAANFNAGSTLRLDLLNKDTHDKLLFGNQFTDAGLNLATTGAGVTLDLNLLPGFSAAINDTFTILSGYQAGGFSGTFNGLADKSIFNVGGVDFQIDYGVNETFLTVVPEPGTILLLGFSGLALLLVRRYQR